MLGLGSDYDRWLTTQPEPAELPMPGDEFYPRCCKCGAFLKREPESSETKSAGAICAGYYPGCEIEPECGSLRPHKDHEFVAHAWGELKRTCGKCGHVNIEIEA